MTKKGELYICGTPIGNLDDMTFRGVEVLNNVDLIAAEDTRRTGKLLNYFSINTSLTSYHEHNEEEKAGDLISQIKTGKDIALVSDAGMPGISDPGYQIIKKAIKENINLTPIPGPTALISALVVSGLPMNRFVFEGFIPRKGKDRERFLDKLMAEEGTVVFYESPYRLQETVKELTNLIGDRQMAVIRELSKIHEEKIYGTVSEVLEKIKEREIKGEIVVVIEGRNKITEEKEGWEDLSIVEHVELLMENGYTKKKAIKKVAKLRNLPKSKVYKKAIVINVEK